VGTIKIIITSLLLCCVLIDPVVVTFTWLNYQKTVVKEEVNRQVISNIDQDDLVLLQFSKEEAGNELQWENSKEFEYNQQMYDVVKTMTLGDTVYYWCWMDRKETNLNRRLDELTARELGKDQRIKEKPDRFISSFKPLFCTVSFDWKGSTPESLCKPLSIFLDFYSSIKIQPPTPPPQLS
jgi:hypothetical protein